MAKSTFPILVPQRRSHAAGPWGAELHTAPHRLSRGKELLSPSWSSHHVRMCQSQRALRLPP